MKRREGDPMTTPLRPRTAAGRKFAELLWNAENINGDKYILAIEAEAASDLHAALERLLTHVEAAADCPYPQTGKDACDHRPNLRYEASRARAALAAAESDYDATILQGYAGPLDTQGAPAVPVQPDDLAAPAAGREHWTPESHAMLDAITSRQTAPAADGLDVDPNPKIDPCALDAERLADAIKSRYGLAIHLREPSRELNRVTVVMPEGSTFTPGPGLTPLDEPSREPGEKG